MIVVVVMKAVYGGGQAEYNKSSHLKNIKTSYLEYYIQEIGSLFHVENKNHTHFPSNRWRREAIQV